MTAKFEGDLVDWRMEHGSYCVLCPLNHKRRVGCAGPLDAPNILIGEMPGKDETEWNEHSQPYGEPFQGRSGQMWKQHLLGPTGHVTMIPGLKYPKVKSINSFIMNAAMCQPPKNKATSPQGRRALLCCHDSAVNLLKELFKRKPGRGLGPQGGMALALLTGKDKIGLYRGRVEQIDVDALPLYGFEYVAKKVMHGKRPWIIDPSVREGDWKLFEWVLKKILTWQRQGLRTQAKRKVKEQAYHEKHPVPFDFSCVICAADPAHQANLRLVRESQNLL